MLVTGLQIARSVMMIAPGTNVRRVELLPKGGPAITVANHGSRLDCFALMNVRGLSRLRHVRPVGITKGRTTGAITWKCYAG